MKVGQSGEEVDLDVHNLIATRVAAEMAMLARMRGFMKKRMQGIGFEGRRPAVKGRRPGNHAYTSSVR